jgi:CubicO group peptidase (beta-lactamase class C family)
VGRVSAIESSLTAAMQRLGIPGLSVAVVVRGEMRWAAGYGLADVENQVPATAATVYRFASVSKPITGTAALQLAAGGRLDLDAPVQRYLPGFPEKPWPVTTRQLLCHQAGVRNWTDEEFHNTRHFTGLADSVRVFQDDPLLFEPGTKTQYSSFGFTLAGQVVEAAAEVPFVEYLRSRIFEPAHMEQTRDDDVLAVIPRRAAGYQHGPAGELLNSPLTDTSNRLPGGGLCGTAEDLGRFASALLGGVLLKPATFRLAITPQKLRGGRITGYGLGWVIGRSKRGPEAYHVGGQPRVSTILYLVPDAGVAIAILVNLEGVEAALLDLARQITPSLF